MRCMAFWFRVYVPPTIRCIEREFGYTPKYDYFRLELYAIYSEQAISFFTFVAKCQLSLYFMLLLTVVLVFYSALYHARLLRVLNKIFSIQYKSEWESANNWHVFACIGL